MIRPTSIALALCLSGPLAASETVCRPGVLGVTNCRDAGPRPMARPPLDDSGLEKVRAQPQAQSDLPELVPAWRTNRLGSTLIDGQVTGPCRRDTLGHLRCR